VKFLDALKSGKRIKHIGWYDSQWILWNSPEQYLLISKKLLDSNDWEVENDQKDKKK